MPEFQETKLEAGIVNRAYDGVGANTLIDGEVRFEPTPTAVIDTTQSTAVDRNTPPPADRIAPKCRYNFSKVQKYIGFGNYTIALLLVVYTSILGPGKRQTETCVSVFCCFCESLANFAGSFQPPDCSAAACEV